MRAHIIHLLSLSVLLVALGCGRRTQGPGACTTAATRPSSLPQSEWSRDPLYQGFGGLLVIQKYRSHRDSGLDSTALVTTQCSFFADFKESPARGFEIWTARDCLDFALIKDVTAKVFYKTGYISFKVTTPELQALAMARPTLADKTGLSLKNTLFESYFNPVPEKLLESMGQPASLGCKGTESSCQNPLRMKKVTLLPQGTLSPEVTNVLEKLASLQSTTRTSSRVSEESKATARALQSTLQTFETQYGLFQERRLASALQACHTDSSGSFFCREKARVLEYAEKAQLLSAESATLLHDVWKGEKRPALNAEAQELSALLNKATQEVQQKVFEIFQRKATIALQSNYALTVPARLDRVSYLSLPVNLAHPALSGVTLSAAADGLRFVADGKRNPNFASPLCFQTGTILTLDRLFPLAALGPADCREAEGSAVLPFPEFDSKAAAEESIVSVSSDRKKTALEQTKPPEKSVSPPQPAAPVPVNGKPAEPAKKPITVGEAEHAGTTPPQEVAQNTERRTIQVSVPVSQPARPTQPSTASDRGGNMPPSGEPMVAARESDTTRTEPVQSASTAERQNLPEVRPLPATTHEPLPDDVRIPSQEDVKVAARGPEDGC